MSRYNHSRGYIFLALLFGLVLFSCFVGMGTEYSTESFETAAGGLHFAEAPNRPTAVRFGIGIAIQQANIAGHFSNVPTDLAKNVYDTHTVIGKTTADHPLLCGLYRVSTDHGPATAIVHHDKRHIEFHFHSKGKENHDELRGKPFTILQYSKNDDEFAKSYERGCSAM